MYDHSPQPLHISEHGIHELAEGHIFKREKDRVRISSQAINIRCVK